MHTEVYESLTDLLKSIESKSVIEMSASFHASTGALDRLRLAYADKQRESIASINQNLKDLFQNGIIQTYNLERIEEARQRIFLIAQGDPRLRDLFK